MSSGDYDGGLRDISVLPGRVKQMDDPLAGAEQFTLRAEFG